MTYDPGAEADPTPASYEPLLRAGVPGAPQTDSHAGLFGRSFLSRRSHFESRALVRSRRESDLAAPPLRRNHLRMARIFVKLADGKTAEIEAPSYDSADQVLDAFLAQQDEFMQKWLPAKLEGRSCFVQRDQIVAVSTSRL
jgi:hypothetical protein